ncbi:MAG TPA: hypothetical protein VEL28_17190 [Candidatus Binatia bacterium]|nr:hypothetical protein [Candidatus Binatia bacterium]
MSPRTLRTLIAVGVGLPLALAGCVSGPRSRPKSKLNYLSGEHYDATGVLQGIPVRIERQAALTRVEGQAMVRHSRFVETPMKFTSLILYGDAQEVARTSTDQAGRFTFLTDLEDGVYRIVSGDDRYTGEARITVRGYQLSSLMLIFGPHAPASDAVTNLAPGRPE